MKCNGLKTTQIKLIDFTKESIIVDCEELEKIIKRLNSSFVIGYEFSVYDGIENLKDVIVEVKNFTFNDNILYGDLLLIKSMETILTNFLIGGLEIGLEIIPILIFNTQDNNKILKDIIRFDIKFQY